MRSIYSAEIFVIVFVCCATVRLSALNLLNESDDYSALRPLTNMVFYNNTLYVGATGEILALGEDLKEKDTVDTCNNTDCRNVNKLLLIDKYDDILITCGTKDKDGFCRIYYANDLEKDLEKDIRNKQLKVSSDVKRPVAGILNSKGKLDLAVTFGPGIGNQKGGNNFVSYDHAISRRNLDSLTTDVHLNLQIHNKSDSEDYVIYYKSAFEHAGFTYFTTNQKEYVGGQKYVSKLVRICQTYSTNKHLYSFMDIPLQCHRNGKIYNLIQDSFIIDSPTGSEKNFVAAFTSGSDPENPVGDSVICSINFSQLNESINAAWKDFATCANNGTGERYLPDNRKVCLTAAVSDSDYCDTPSTYSYLIGNTAVALTQGYNLSSTDGYITVLQGIKLRNKRVVIMAGTSQGKLIRLNMQNDMLQEYDKITVDNGIPVQEIIQEDDENLYVMSETKVFRYGSSNCSEFETCQETMKGSNPLCGWCIFQNRATRNDTMSCPNAEDHWLSSSKQCVSLELNVKGVLVGSAPKTVQVTAQPSFDKLKGYNYTCIFRSKNMSELGRSEATQNSSTGALSCSIPPVNEHTEADLEIMVNNKFKLASTPFLFYKCYHFKRCGDCFDPRVISCVWDQRDATCKRGSDAIENIVIDKSKCPALNDSRGKHYIPGDSSFEITLEASNINSSQDNKQFECYSKDIGISLAEIVSSGINCTFDFSAQNEPKKDFTIQVRYKINKVAIEDDYGNYVTVYNCNLLARNCSFCEALNPLRYSCGWCNNKCSYITDSCNDPCPPPNLTKILPVDGPEAGGTIVTIYGTELGSEYEDVTKITIAGVSCSISTEPGITQNDDFSKKAPHLIVCTTGSKDNIETGSVNITVNNKQSTGTVQFSYKKPTITAVMPLSGPYDGGTTVTIFGENLGIGNRKNITILFGSLDIDARLDPYFPVTITEKFNYTIKFEMHPSVEPKKSLSLYMNGVKVTQVYNIFVYQYVANPSISGISPKKAILSGGTGITINGQNLTNAHKAKLEGTFLGETLRSPCIIQSQEMAVCFAPEAKANLKNKLKDLIGKENNSKRKRRATCQGCIEVEIAVYLDGFKEPFKITYFRDPVISNFDESDGVRLFGSDDQELKVYGKYLNLVAKETDVNITIGLDKCSLLELKDDTLTCLAPSKQPATGNPNMKIPEVNVSIGNVQVRVGFLEYEKQNQLIIIIAGAVGGCLLAIIIIAVAVGLYKYRKVGRKAKEYERSLADMEMEIKRVAREEFLDMHTTMSSVNKNLVEQGFPYHNYQQFACNVMFTVDYLWTEPVVSNGKMTDDERLKANKAMDSLESLIHNKFFLVSVISTMEKEKRFFIREKSNLAGNLCAVLMGKMDYLNEILILLMTNLVQDSSAKKHKTLFRRCESITEKLLSNWLSLCLYPHVKKNSGSPLYLLYIATQKTMESGPIDAVTGDAKYTLSEEKLLKKWSASTEEDGDQDLKFEAKALTLNVVVDNGEEIFKCKVLDCDTISQVKSKCLNQIYVNFPASQLSVGANDLALEWHMGFGGALKLRDEDNTSKRDGHWIRFNTLAHYIVKDESNMALVDPHNVDLTQQEDYVNLANVNMDNVCDGSIDSSQPLTPNDEENPHELNHWHLVKKEEESSNEGKSAIAELYLNRLFTTKQSLMEYMRPLFDIVLDHDKCPPPTKFLYDFLDELGEKYKVDTDTVHAWKSHSYAIRVWASLMQMPNLLFDITIPDFMSANLDIISQVFRESFSLTPQKFTKDSPPQKLIFHHEMNHYRERVKEFYKNVKVDPQNSDEFRQYMAEVNRMQQNTSFNKVSALYRFYKQLKPYFEDILENLQTSKEASSLELDRKLEQVIAIMEEED